MAKEIQGLTPKAKEVLQRNAELRRKDNKFIKIQARRKEDINFQSRKDRPSRSRV